MVNIREQLVTSTSKIYAGANTRKFITVHETANRSVGANAAAHANLQSRDNVRNASWHYQVDDKEAVQSFPHTARCWHAGDGRGAGNYSSLAIEICVNADGDYSKAISNAAELVSHLMASEGIPLANVVQHGRWSGKNCPAILRSGSAGITWDGFLNLVTGAAPTPAPNPSPAPAGPVVIAKGVAAPAFPLPSGHCFGPKSGPAWMHSGYFNHRENLRTWQQRMKDRGWVIAADGLYGNQTGDVAEAFQREKGLGVDRLIGPETWAAAWTADITRG